MSQPAWAAWIEMWETPGRTIEVAVAARMGCVDGNIYQLGRRCNRRVAARMGCVDGNKSGIHRKSRPRSRSPHGLRGLK